MFESYSLDNRYSVDDLSKVKQLILADSVTKEFKQNFEGPFHNKIISRRYVFDWNQHVEVSEIIKNGFPDEVKNKIIVDHCYLLQSFAPYEIHCDYNWVKCLDNEEPYYFVVIPLETVNAQTVVLNQNGAYTHWVDYKQEHDPLAESDQMSVDEYKKYFSHTWEHERPYVSIHKVFDWKLGSIFLGDIKRFHCSNNFLEHGVTQKECIILFSKKNLND